MEAHSSGLGICIPAGQGTETVSLKCPSVLMCSDLERVLLQKRFFACFSTVVWIG